MNIANSHYDVAIIGAGACGIAAALSAKASHKKILLIEQLKEPAVRLKASGGGKCNISNTLEQSLFLEAFGKQRFFIRPALERYDSHWLRELFGSLGVELVAKDGFRLFPASHHSTELVDALKDAIKDHSITQKCNTRIISATKLSEYFELTSQEGQRFYTSKLILASGGLGYKELGATGDGLLIAQSFGHTITPTYPAMMPLEVAQSWVANCRADTIAKCHISVDMKKYKKLSQCGDLIFTKNGIRGPVVLDFSRNITPLLEEFGEVPVVLNMVKGRDFESLKSYFAALPPQTTAIDALCSLLPQSVANEMLGLCDIAPQKPLNELSNKAKNRLYSLLERTPLRITGSQGFKKAMVTRGGVSTKEVDSQTMQSKIVQGLYFCGELLDIDGPCGGYNLQWAFSSGYLSGKLC